MNTPTPNLFVLGAAKSGTTTLADALRTHADIFVPELKELNFFSGDENYAKGLDWYLSTFFSHSGAFRYRADAAPSYLYYADKVAPRMSAALPGDNLKFIVVLRNPVDRAYSQYWHNRNRVQIEPLSFEEALAAEPRRTQEEEAELNRLGLLGHAYFQIGLYDNQIRVFWDHFAPRQFLVLLYEDLQLSRFVETLGLVHDFLEVRRTEMGVIHSNPASSLRSRHLDVLIRRRSAFKEVLKRYVGIERRTHLKNLLLRLNSKREQYPSMDPSTRQMLVQRFTPSIRRLELLIERDLSSWLM